MTLRHGSCCCFSKPNQAGGKTRLSPHDGSKLAPEWWKLAGILPNDGETGVPGKVRRDESGTT